MTTLIPKFDFKNGGATPAGAINRPINEKLQEVVSVLDFGADLTGVADSTAAIQAALNTAKSVYFPAGTYKVNTTLTPANGQKIYGNNKLNTIINSPASVKTFYWHPAGPIDKLGPQITDLAINSDFPITLNDTSVTVDNGSGDAPCMACLFENLVLRPITTNAGIGISCTKMFDSKITLCDIEFFNYNILLLGCDINHIYDNRISQYNTYGILDQSAQSFGSQNEIFHNDMGGGGTSSIAIKSTSRAVSIYDNYIEASATISGFIDVSNIGVPTFGSNVSQPSFSIVIRDNRFDGENNGTFVVRIDPTSSVSIICENRETSGNPGTSLFTPATNYAPAFYNNVHGLIMTIKGTSWGVWNGYTNRTLPKLISNGILIDGEILPALNQALQTDSCELFGSQIVIPQATSTSNIIFIAPTSSNNIYFPSTVTLTVTIMARTTSATGDTLGAYMFGITASTPFTLTQQFQKFSFTFTGPAYSATNQALALTRATSNGDILIDSISWTY